ncbi:MAG: hypothetical protein NTY46_00010 [Candidatus Sumerlaeota bacterium]|nr:hypothetical protein [Candidatus Sumerlaeota bacterium]
MPEPGQTQTPKNSRETRQKGLFHPPALWWRGWARPFLAKHKWSLIGLVFVTAALLGFTGLFGQKDRSTVGDGHARILMM